MPTYDRVTRFRRVLATAATAFVCSASLSAQTPVGVSPGSTGAPTELGSSCPTFSWSGVAGSVGHDLVLYRVASDGRLQLAFQTHVPGDARSWTPPAPACPRPGSEYAWTVRAATAEGESSWSEPLLFTTRDTPTGDEMRRALETLHRYRQGALGVDRSLAEATPGDDDGLESAVAPALRPLPETPSAARSATVAPRPSAVEPEGPLTGSTVGETPGPRDVSAPGEYSLSLDGDIDLGGAIFREGYPFLHNDGGAAYSNTGLGLLAMVSLTPGDPDTTSGAENTAVGGRALRNLTSGSQNTAVGFDALRDTSTGGVNTAVGSRALRNNTSGFSNTAVGDRAARSNSTGAFNTAAGRAALYSNASGDHNTAVGYRALVLDTGNSNVAVGSLALTNSSTGLNNTAVGYGAMYDASAAHYSTAIGRFAGYTWTDGIDNIAIGSGAYGLAGDTGVIRIGSNVFHTKAYVGGIFNSVLTSGSQVFVNSSGQLGTSTSSARFKQDIHGLEGVSEQLRALRPVSFRYKDELMGLGAEDNPLEYGLIAEEVAEIFPELVIYDDEGEPYTVRYHLLAPLLLAELQRQDRDRETEVAELRGQLADLRRRLDAVSGQAGGGDHPTSDF